MDKSISSKDTLGRYSIVMTGTDPSNPSGGIAFAIPGYQQAFIELGLRPDMRTTHRVGLAGKVVPWTQELFRLRKILTTIHAEGKVPLVYAHAGAGPSIVREVILLRRASSFGARTMIQLHSPTLEDILASPSAGSLLCSALRRCDVVCVLSKYWQRLLRTYGVENTAVVSNPLPPEVAVKLEQAEEPPGESGPIRILAMSRLAHGKGFEAVIDAFELINLPDVQLDIAGDGPLREFLLARIEKSPARARIHFHGWVTGEKKNVLLRRCHCFFLPSRSDSFGMVFLEAMAAGRPCVALAHRGVEEVVAQGKTGLLVSADEATPERLADMVCEVLDRRTTEYSGELCRAYVKERFSTTAIGTQLSAAIDRIKY